MNWRQICGLGWVAGMAAGAALAASLECDGLDGAGRPRLSQANAVGQVAALEASDDLRTWNEVGRLWGAFAGFPDLTAGGEQRRFYRTRLFNRTAADDWKNHLVVPGDPCLSPEPGYGQFESRWVKFAIRVAEPGRVWFQDSSRYVFHYDFATARLPGFQGMSREAFDAVSLRRAGQQVVLGAVLLAPGTEPSELAIQLVGLDPYPREDAIRWLETVSAVLQAPPTLRRFYFPTYEQQATARADADFFAGRGLPVGAAARWVSADECYAPGWALGRLVSLSGAEVSAAYADGRLGPGDILLVDAVPAEIPPVAGVLALTPATPNSHVAILAQSFGIPFGYFAAEADRERLRGWAGQEVALRIEENFWGCQMKAVSVHGQLTSDQRAALLAYKQLPTLDLVPRERAGRLSMPVDGLHPADLRYVGGKAANLGVLRRAIPANAPSPAIAFTFDLWEDYLGQPVAGGGTLGERIRARLAGFAWPPDIARLRAALVDIRGWFTDETDFTGSQRQAIIAALTEAGLDPGRKIRFRSSTNVEDSDSFSGAGLYDSYSGCLADDLDADGAGPCACDPAEARERGVFRALRKVFASFYNENACLERLRHGVDESQAGMAVLVHHSTPDEFEMANGVATVALSKPVGGSRSLAIELVTQAGAVSVANPDAVAVPELVRADAWAGQPFWLRFERASSLVPLGGKVMPWETAYQQLAGLLDRATAGWEGEYPARREFTLDFEYKRVAPGGELRIKQVRPVPQPPVGKPLVPWLLNETNEWVVFQGEYGDVFAKHRLKSFWALQTAALPLVPTNLTHTPLRQIEAMVPQGLEIRQHAGLITEFPEYSHRREAGDAVDRWTWGAGDTRQEFELRVTLPATLPPGSSPLLFLSDGAVSLSLTHAQPQLTVDWEGPGKTLTDQVRLTPRQGTGPRSLRQSRMMVDGGLRIETEFFWPPAPTGPTAGYTAPLQAWIETRITGLLAEPVVLRGEFAQTYHPGHHNFWETFLFDPHLDPGVPAAQQAALRERNIRGLLAVWSDPSDIQIWGLDDTLQQP